jgi:hypothetical protein
MGKGGMYRCLVGNLKERDRSSFLIFIRFRYTQYENGWNGTITYIHCYLLMMGN